MPDPRWTDEQTAILDERTRDLARPVRARQQHATVPAVVISVVGEHYALEIAAVQGVAALDRLTPLPLAPGSVAGLVVRAGAVLPVFHLRAVMELPLRALPERAQVLFLGTRAAELGVLVDEVGDVRHIDLDRLAPAPTSLSPTARQLVRGIDPDGLPLLDGRALLASERLIVDLPIADLLRSRGPSQ
jgi:purine-binding chemotaxis protein CheW